MKFYTSDTKDERLDYLREMAFGWTTEWLAGQVADREASLAQARSAAQAAIPGLEEKIRADYRAGRSTAETEKQLAFEKGYLKSVEERITGELETLRPILENRLKVQKQAEQQRIEAAEAVIREKLRSGWPGDQASFEAALPEMLQRWRIDQAMTAATEKSEAEKHYRNIFNSAGGPVEQQPGE